MTDPLDTAPRILVSKIGKLAVSETFIEDHVRKLPGVAAFHDADPGKSSRIVASLMRRTGWQGLTPGRYWDDVIARARADVVLAEFGETGVAMLSASRRARVPLVVHFHGSDAWLSAHSHRHSYKKLFRHTAAIVVASESMARRLGELGAPAEKLRLVRIGVDTNVVRPADPASAPIRFVGIGRFVDVKGHDYTIRAFAKVREAFPDATLTIVGDGPLRPACLRLVHELALEDAVDLPGALPREDVLPVLHGARALVHHAVTSHVGGREGGPVVVAEAQAAGLPVVATSHGGIPEMVADDVSGYLVDERDVDAMARAMSQLAAHPETASEMGRAGRERVVREQSLEATIEQLHNVLAEAGERMRTQNEHVGRKRFRPPLRRLVRLVVERPVARRSYYGDPDEYWDARLRQFEDSLRGVGSIGESAEANEADYALKWQVVGTELDRLASAGARTLLDAGAGIGYFASRAASMGFDVDAIDFSRSAIERVRGIPGIRRLTLASVADYTSPEQYDVVLCIDVLFHIVDDALWSRSVRNLARLTAPSGTLLLQESLAVHRAPRTRASLEGRDHTRWRTLGEYTRELAEWEVAAHVKYELPREGSQKDLLSFRRRDEQLRTDAPVRG